MAMQRGLWDRSVVAVTSWVVLLGATSFPFRSPVWAGGEPAAEPQPVQAPKPKSPVTAGAQRTHPAERHQLFAVAALVLPNVRGDREKALQRIESYTRRAAAQGARIVVAPEACLDGYLCHQPGVTRERFSKLAETDDGPSITRLRRLTRELDLYLCVGFSEMEGGALYNTALFLGPDGRSVGKYRKTHGVEEFYKPGAELPVFPTRYGRVGVLICYDRQLPEAARTLASKGAEILLIPSNGMWGGMNDVLLRIRAYENGMYIVFAHPRDGLVIDPGGRIIAANLSVPGQGVGLPTNTDTEDAGGWPEAVTRTIDVEAWRSARGNLGQRRSNLYTTP